MRNGLSKGAKKQLLNLTVLLALIALTLGILLSSNRELNFADIGDFLRRSNPWLLVAAFGCMAGFILFEAISLYLICRALGHKCRFGSSIVYSTADVYYSAITPSAAGGQPASAYYMVKDGMSGGRATFSLVFNLIAYTGAILILGLSAFILRPGMFGQFGSFVKVLVILGIVIQFLLLGFFIGCMFWHGAVLKCGNGLITLLHRMRVLKKEDKWRSKLIGAVDKYKDSRSVLHTHRMLFVFVLLLNILQRASQMLIPCFVCAAAMPDASFLDIFVMQAFVTLGYNSIPLPGGVGAFEYMYLHVYSLRFNDAFILAAMMVTRFISYYICLAISGIVTLAYHGAIMRRKTPDDAVEDTADAAEDSANESGSPPDIPPETTLTQEEQPPETEETHSDE